MELPSNIFCQYSNCNSVFIVHHRASDILEACNNPPKKSKPRSTGSDCDIYHSSDDLLLTLTDNSLVEDSHSSCCSPLSNGKHKHDNSHKELTKKEGGGKRISSCKRIMKEPVILPCNHAYCLECATNLPKSVCQVCARAFTFRDVKVNKFIQQICDWFGENRTFLSLLLGQDITQPPIIPITLTPTIPATPMRLSRSASSEITRSRSYTSPLTRSNSTDSISSTILETDDEPLTVDHHSDRDNGDSTRLAKFHVELYPKPSEEGNGNSPLPHKRHRFSLMSKSSINRSGHDRKASPKFSSPTSTPIGGSGAGGGGIFRRIRSKKEEHSPPLPHELSPPLTPKEEASKKDVRAEKSDRVVTKRENTPVFGSDNSFGLMGMHKRNHSLVQASEKITPVHKTKSKSFTPSNMPPNFLPPPSIRPTPKETISAPSTPTMGSSSSTSLVLPPPLSLSTPALPAFQHTPRHSPDTVVNDVTPPSSSTPTLKSQSAHTTANAYSTAVSFVGAAYGASSSSSSSSSASPSTPTPSVIGLGSTSVPNRLPSVCNSAFKPAQGGVIIKPHLVSTTSLPHHVPPATRDAPDAKPSKTPPTKLVSRSKISNGNLTSPHSLHVSVKGLEESPTPFNSIGGNISTVPSSAFSRPIKLATPTSTPPAPLSDIFSLNISRKIEFRENRRVSQLPINRRITSIFSAPSQISSESIDPTEALESMAMYLPTEALEIGVVLATKDQKCELRVPVPKLLPLPLGHKTNQLSISSEAHTLAILKPIIVKRLSLPNMPLAQATWKSAVSVSKGSSMELVQDNIPPPRSGSFSQTRISVSPPPPPHPSALSHRSSHNHGKIGSLFISKFKSFSVSSEDLKRDMNAEETLKLQGRNQTLMDVSKMTKILGVEMGKELLQWTTKMENYKKYRWCTGDPAMYEGPPVQPKPGWNVEYRGSVPWGKLNFDIEDKYRDVCWYHEHFYLKPHATFLAGTPENPLFIAVDTDGSPPYKVLVRSIASDDRLCVLDYSRKYITKVLELDSENTRHVKDISIQREMSQWDMGEVSRNFKFGILYCKANQTTEEQIFSNTGPGCSEYESFLSCLGTKVKLKGWPNFSGGLDVENDYDGTHSIYSKYKQYEIMFHVSTFLQHETNDPQQLAKKKHIGNDIVVLVFMEAGAPPLDPTFMRTQFTQVYILVQPVYSADGSSSPLFRISVAAKDGVRPFGPSIPQNVEFGLDHMLKSFLLPKLLNAERASLSSDVFRNKLASARRLFISHLLASAK